MKKYLFMLALLQGHNGTAQATHWIVDSSHAKVAFTVSHFGISETEGRFTSFRGTILSDNSNFSDAVIDFSIDVTVSTQMILKEMSICVPLIFLMQINILRSGLPAKHSYLQEQTSIY